MTRDLKHLTERIEREADMSCRFREKIHLMPPVGWLNDPNGLCQFKGVYHAFFQYSPFCADGGVKMWGHYTSENMIDWNYQGAALYPDQPFDCGGVYSGSALVDNGRMYLYYTGNVKLEDKDYDYINGGREANTVLVESEDGIHFGRKKKLMGNRDYPEDLTLHVRDPKVWKEEDTFYMIQGARTKDDTGVAVIFESRDKENWVYRSRVAAEKPFGYMWECPDYIEKDGARLLSASVQGLNGEDWKDRNVYQSGYFIVEGDILGEYRLGEYRLWDYGFDYYAPQSFVAEDGRVVQIGWMGMPDCEDYRNPTTKDGWQHCFTFPREISVKAGRVCQTPVRELDRKKKLVKKSTGQIKMEGYPVYEADIEGITDGHFRAVLGDELILEYREGRFEMRFTDRELTSASAGRGIRYQEMDGIRNVRILADASSAEVFINDGESVFTTRYYPEKDKLLVEAEDARIRFYEIV